MEDMGDMGDNDSDVRQVIDDEDGGYPRESLQEQLDEHLDAPVNPNK